MPITAFNSFTDGLDSNQRSREHVIANTNLEDDHLWVPYEDGVWLQPCCFNATSGGFSVVLKGRHGEPAPELRILTTGASENGAKQTFERAAAVSSKQPLGQFSVRQLLRPHI
jgi:hypothetical protein